MPDRNEIPEKYRWRLEDIYEGAEDWENALQAVEKLIAGFSRFERRLHDSEMLLEAMKSYASMQEIAISVLSYARMRRDEDNRVAANQALTSRAQAMLTRLETAVSFMTPELLAAPEGYLSEIAARPDFSDFAVTLRKIERERPHTLSAAEEKIVAMAGEIGAAPDNVYSMLSDADMKFPTIAGEGGIPVEITQAGFIPLMMSRDRRVREAAFTGLYEVFKGFSATIPAIYGASVKADFFHAQTSKHASALEAALFPDEVPLSVYENLIRSVRGRIPSLNRFVTRNGELIGVDRMRMIDVYVPAVEGFDVKLPFDEAYELVVGALSALGEDYQMVLRRARGEKWIDALENAGKSPGAYSWGTYGTHPYVLLNYKETLDALLTIAHEMGHSLHTYLSNKAQPAPMADYSLFVAEVASTVNEVLVLMYLLDRHPEKSAQSYLLNNLLQAYRTTLFRQTMFAEFEMIAHEMAEKGEALTGESLNRVYAELNRTYYPSIEQTDLIQYEWMRIPHFYNAFYVYQYATGFSAAMAIAGMIREEGAPAVERYIRFLSAGGSLYPIDALKLAGVDMSTPEPVEKALTMFEQLLDRYKKASE
ncbi:MAG: oligoendopeptidase F [Clostridiales bacterium]|nr:oligoendopeptidase F [Clostridiales bacterium]